MTALMPCKFCRFCVPVDAKHGTCRRESPVMLRGSVDATWPKVELDGPGCGKGKPHEQELSISGGGPRL